MAEAPVIAGPFRADGDPVRVEAVGMEALGVIRSMNLAIFEEQRIINTFDREDLLMLLAYVDDAPVGFKIGYRLNRFVFYSAKGAVLPEYRQSGVARQLLYAMMQQVRDQGYRRFCYDTFPNKHPGMTFLGLSEGFRVVKADFNSVYRDFRLRLETDL